MQILDSMGLLFQNTNPIIVEHWRGGDLLSKEITHNGITTVGKNDLLDEAFRAQTQHTAWYFGLIDNSGFSALAAADTMGSHAGWTELTAYSDATRVAWAPDAASAGAISNSTASTFNMNATNTVYGAFLTTISTKGGTTGILWATAAFSSAKAVINGDQIKLTYTLSA